MSNWLYSLIIVLAVGTAAGVARFTQSRLSLTRGQKWGIGLGAFCGAMIGAKLPFVFSDWNAFASGIAWFSDGKTILLGLVGGYVGVELAKWAMQIRVRTGDSFAVPVPIAVSIGRVGCFVGGCCYGTPTDLPWGVRFPAVDDLPRHPTQLYESLFHALAAAVLAYLMDRKLFPGNLMKLYFIAYAIYRFLSEFIRPEARSIAGITAYQWSCLVIAIGFSYLWWRDATRGHNNEFGPQ
jgi:phosphatidylglycerol---prolipoprotein diacylglyceryl transferase